MTTNHALALVTALAIAVAAMLTGCEAGAPAVARPSTSAVDTTVASTSTPVTPAVTETAPPSPDELLVAYLYDASLEGAAAAATSPYQAAELAFDAASADGVTPTPVRLVAFDLEAGIERIDHSIGEIAGEPAYVAAIVAPRLVGQAAIVERLDVPAISLAPRDAVQDAAPGSWLRLVPSVDVLGSVAGAWAADRVEVHGTLCPSPAAADGSRFGRAAAAAADGRLEVTEPVAPVEAAAPACDAVIWTGDTDAGIALVGALGRPRPVVVGGPALLDPRFVRETGPAANGTLAVCGCADVSTSLSLRAQRFVQVFQSAYGLAPGPGAVEAWDGAHVVIRALASADTRAEVQAALAEVSVFDGLGGMYQLAPGGELAHPERRVSRYRVEAGRWVAVGAGPTR